MTRALGLDDSPYRHIGTIAAVGGAVRVSGACGDISSGAETASPAVATSTQSQLEPPPPIASAELDGLRRQRSLIVAGAQARRRLAARPNPTRRLQPTPKMW